MANILNLSCVELDNVVWKDNTDSVSALCTTERIWALAPVPAVKPNIKSSEVSGSFTSKATLAAGTIPTPTLPPDKTIEPPDPPIWLALSTIPEYPLKYILLALSYKLKVTPTPALAPS